MFDYKIILLGYSGHGLVVAEAAIGSGLNVLFYADKKECLVNPYQLQYIGYECSDCFEGWKNKNKFILGVGDNYIREKIAQNINNKNQEILTVIHSNASISEYVEMGTGNFFARNCAVNPLVKIGNNCIINTGAVIDHECILNNNIHIAPGAVLAGNVEVGERTFIGANAIIKQGVKIGKDVIIGAGAVVLKNVSDEKIIVGNPGKEL